MTGLCCLYVIWDVETCKSPAAPQPKPLHAWQLGKSGLETDRWSVGSLPRDLSMLVPSTSAHDMSRS